jgi:DeoR/GlpR family transcriptional regulator of sugar metabolism
LIPINDTELRKMHGRSVSITEIAKHFGCCTQTIRARMDKIGIRRRHHVGTPKRKDPTPAEIAERAAAIRATWPEQVERIARWTPPNLLWDGQAFRVLG